MPHSTLLCSTPPPQVSRRRSLQIATQHVPLVTGGLPIVRAVLRKRNPVQGCGFGVAWRDGRLADTHVTQTMLGAHGRIVG